MYLKLYCFGYEATSGNSYIEAWFPMWQYLDVDIMWSEGSECINCYSLMEFGSWQRFGRQDLFEGNVRVIILWTLSYQTHSFSTLHSFLSMLSQDNQLCSTTLSLSKSLVLPQAQRDESKWPWTETSEVIIQNKFIIL